MNSSCTCRHCQVPDAVSSPAAPEPIALPTEPTPIRVHNDGRTQDCTLHPDGRLTMRVGDQTLVNMLTFDEMRERNWANAHIEFDPAPLDTQPAHRAEAPAPLDLFAA